MRNTIFPEALEVSIRSESETRSPPAFSRRSAMAIASLVERASRERLYIDHQGAANATDGL
jgi:hypothetical protein